MLTDVLLLEVSHAARFNMTVDNELANIVGTSAPHDIAGACLELEPRHRMLLTTLFVVPLPHGIACVWIVRGLNWLTDWLGDWLWNWLRNRLWNVDWCRNVHWWG